MGIILSPKDPESTPIRHFYSSCRVEILGNRTPIVPLGLGVPPPSSTPRTPSDFQPEASVAFFEVQDVRLGRDGRRGRDRELRRLAEPRREFAGEEMGKHSLGMR